MSTHSSPFPSCFHPTPTSDRRPSTAAPPPPPPPPPSPPPNDKNTNLTTCLYNTQLGLFSLTWSRTLFGHSLHLNLHPHQNLFDFSPSSSPLSSSSSSSSALSFHLHVKNFIFCRKSGSKKINKFHIFWDLSRAKFGSGPEPQSGFYLAVVVDAEMFLLVGDSVKEAYSKTKAKKHEPKSQVLILRREHVFGNRVYRTHARIGGKNREILIDCNVNNHGDARLCINVDNKRVLQIKKLKWKFRGNEKIEVDGTSLQVSWDVYNWLFEDGVDGHAVFMFRFEKDENFEETNNNSEVSLVKDMVLWSGSTTCSFGMNEIELRKMRKSMLRSARSSSSSSISSSASSGGSSSVMEWASMEENELTGPVGFSLLVYAWKR